MSDILGPAIDRLRKAANNEVDETTFGINMIPHTQQVTAFSALGNLVISEASPAPINLEIDQLARYVHRQLQFLPQAQGS